MSETASEDFDQRFDDDDDDITATLDLEHAERPGLTARRVDVDFPTWMVEALDREAPRLGVTRQSVIKIWIADRLERRPPAQPEPIRRPVPPGRKRCQ